MPLQPGVPYANGSVDGHLTPLGSQPQGVTVLANRHTINHTHLTGIDGLKAALMALHVLVSDLAL